MKRIAIALFRNDLRVHDQPNLYSAIQSIQNAKSDGYLLPVYCFDPRQIDLTALNGQLEGESTKFDKAVTWHYRVPRCTNHRAKLLVETVQALSKKLRQHNSDLLVRYGEPEKIVASLVNFLQDKHQADVEVYLQSEYTYEEQRTERLLDKACRLNLTEGGLTMVHPDDVTFKHCPHVFTQFRQQVEGLHEKMVRDVLQMPSKFPSFPSEAREFQPGHKEEYMRHIANLDESFNEGSMVAYTGGEEAALKRLQHYCGGGNSPLYTYKQTRNSLSGIDDSSHFSAFLANGSLSAREIYRQIKETESKNGSTQDSYWLVFELLWRDFFKFLFADTGNTMFYQYAFHEAGDAPPKHQKHTKHGHQDRGQQFSRGQANQQLKKWNTNEKFYDAWVKGQTGVPFIDANMRELAATGYQSNRGRQNTADFLSGQLHVDWRWGAEYFESALIDHDVCSNTGNWQYTAGSIDPRSRSFNILKQAKDYDAHGDYVKQWIPELRNVPAEFVHHPWTIKDRSQYDGLQDYPEKPIIQRSEWARQIERKGGQGSKSGRANPSEKSRRGGRGGKH